jgi:Na+/H+-dicarboxylate symporter/ABC-type amino acid transport substrate-binding protein
VARPGLTTPRSLSARIFAGLVIGVVIGLFFGERTAVLQIAADAYLKLLQMTVLPHVTVSIISGLGSLSATEAWTIGKRVGAVMVLLWVLALAAVLPFALMFPDSQNASFFSTTLVQEREPFDFLNLYIPTNPFNSLANNIVPAVVLFSVVLGVALIAVPEKERLLSVLKVATAAVSRATSFVVAITPYGVCAIGAVMAGTLRLEEFERLQVYLASYAVMALLLSLWVLPGLVAALTPISYRALMSKNRDALVMAFMTTSLFAVLPLLTEQAKDLVREQGHGDKAEAAADVIVPASFNFPHSGKLLSLSFVLFAGWFTDAQLQPTQYPTLAGAGLLAMFGSVNAAIPFLLDLFRIPGDTFQLFLASGVVNARLGTLVAAVHTVVVAVLGTCAVSGLLKFEPRKLARFGLTTLILTAAAVGGTRAALAVALNRPYDKDAMLTARGLLRDRGTPRVFKAGEPIPSLPPVARSMLDRIRERQAVRIGYFEDSLPYVFFNQRGELVGFDGEMAMQLARELGVTAEFVPVERTVLDRGLDSSICDVIMSGAVITADRAVQLQFSSSYLDETVAFIVPDHLTASFTEWSSVRTIRNLRLRMPRAPYFAQKVRDELGDVDITFVDRMDDLFVRSEMPADAFMATAERGSAYTLLHPEYSVAVPRPRPFKVPLAYVIADRDAALTSVINTWIELKRKDGTIEELFAHWILGRDDAPREPRWSVIRNVLHWVP